MCAMGLNWRTIYRIAVFRRDLEKLFAFSASPGECLCRMTNSQNARYSLSKRNLVLFLRFFVFVYHIATCVGVLISMLLMLFVFVLFG